MQQACQPPPIPLLLRRVATVIQKSWRGYLGRQRFRLRWEEYYRALRKVTHAHMSWRAASPTHPPASAPLGTALSHRQVWAAAIPWAPCTAGILQCKGHHHPATLAWLLEPQEHPRLLCTTEVRASRVTSVNWIWILPCVLM